MGHQARIMAGRGAQVDERVPFISIPLADSRHPEVLKLKSELDAGRVPDQFARLTERLHAALLEVTEDLDYVIAHNVCSLNKNLPLTAALRQLSERESRSRRSEE